MKTSYQYAIQYNTHLKQAGLFLDSLIHKHPPFESGDALLLNTEPNTNTLIDDVNSLYIHDELHTIIIPYVNVHFRERMITGWNKLKGFDVKVAVYEFNLQYRNINEYVFGSTNTVGNPYTLFGNSYPNIRLEFVDVGMILSYKSLEYTKLCTALHIVELEPLVWKNYVNQYLVNALIQNSS